MPWPGDARLTRNQFRELYQPSRVLIAIVPSDHDSGFNPITICFNSWIAYKPRMIGMAVQNCNYSYDLIKSARRFTLSVPGPSLLEETVMFGTKSGRDHDKLSESGVHLDYQPDAKVPHLALATGSMHVEVDAILPTGDHLFVAGRVLRMQSGRAAEPPLVSIGARSRGYTLLRKHGQHRLAISNS